MILTILFVFSWWMAGQLSWYYLAKNLMKNSNLDGFDLFMVIPFIGAGYVAAIIISFVMFLDYIADNIKYN